MEDLIIQIITKNLVWKDDAYVFEFFPFDNDTSIKARYIKFHFTKFDKYKATVTLENMTHCILKVEEAEKKNEDFQQFHFKTKQHKTFKSCLSECIKIIKESDHCVSCNRFYLPKDLVNNVCLDCYFQVLIENHEECAICYDDTLPRLYQKLPCKHAFHFSCLLKMNKRECPLCRHPFKFK